jgi:dinuclear metal center YbgI/SA1388 family protein
MVLVHHGIFWNNERLLIDRRQRGRLKALFDYDISLAAYHLVLDAHPEIGNAALLARLLGITDGKAFDEYGVGGRLEKPMRAQDFVTLVEKRLGRVPLSFLNGPDVVKRVAILTGGGGHSLLQASREGYDLFLTGEPTEPALQASRELGVNFLAAGHYATEKLGIQALSGLIASHFGVEQNFIDIPNPV